MEATILITIYLLRVILIWQMVELLKQIKTPKNNRVATGGFLIYVFYLLYSTYLGVPVTPEAIMRIIGLILILIGANRCLQLKGV